MTIGAQEAQISHPVVVTPTVDVVQLKRDGRSVPSTVTADFALRLLESLSDQATLQVPCLAEAALDQNFVEWGRGNGRCSISPTPCLPHEVGRVRAQSIDSDLQVCLKAPALIVANPSEDLGQRARLLNRLEYLLVGRSNVGSRSSV